MFARSCTYYTFYLQNPYLITLFKLKTNTNKYFKEKSTNILCTLTLTRLYFHHYPDSSFDTKFQIPIQQIFKKYIYSALSTNISTFFFKTFLFYSCHNFKLLSSLVISNWREIPTTCRQYNKMAKNSTR